MLNETEKKIAEKMVAEFLFSELSHEDQGVEWVEQSLDALRARLLQNFGQVGISDGDLGWVPMDEEFKLWRDSVSCDTREAEGLLDFVWNTFDSGLLEAMLNWEPEDFINDYTFDCR